MTIGSSFYLRRLFPLSDSFFSSHSKLKENAGSLTSHHKLHEVIGGHLSSVALTDSQGDRSLLQCKFIYERLVEELEKGGLQEEEIIEEEDGVEVGPGICVMCERTMPLTKHHLIPREVSFHFPFAFSLLGA